MSHPAPGPRTPGRSWPSTTPLFGLPAELLVRIRVAAAIWLFSLSADEVLDRQFDESFRQRFLRNERAGHRDVALGFFPPAPNLSDEPTRYASLEVFGICPANT